MSEPMGDEELADIRTWADKAHLDLVDDPHFSVDEMLAVIARLDDAEAEIRRHHADFDRWEDMADRGAKLVEENRRLREFAEHVAKQRTYLTGNPYSSMARSALMTTTNPPTDTGEAGK